MNAASRFRLVAGSILALLLWLACRSAHADEDTTLLAVRLEHMLAYLEADYALAASSTVSDDDAEAEEHTKLADQIQHMASGLPLPPEVAKRVADVSALVRRTAPQSDVSAATDDLRRMLVSTFRIPVSPTLPPNRDHGRALFEQYCAPCHGVTGRADTERAATLKPRPANFLDPMVGEALSPYRISTTIRFGIDGTAMVPFGFLSEADRWDLAFYALGLRHVAPPADDGPTYGVSELARLSDAELRADLRAGGVPEASVEPTMTELRRRAPFEDWVRRDALGRARAALNEARDALAEGDRAAALERAHRAANRGLRRAEPALRSVDPGLAREARVAFAAVDSRITAGAPAADGSAVIARALQITLRAERTLWRAYGKGGATTRAIRTAGLLAVGGVGDVLLVVALLILLTSAGLARAKKSVHRGWIVALPIGIAASVLWSRMPAASSAGPALIEGPLSALAACAAVSLGALLLVRRRALGSADAATRALFAPPVVLFAVPWLATFRDVFAGTSLFSSLLFCDPRPLPIVAGMLIATCGLLLLAIAALRALRNASPRALVRIGGGLLAAAVVPFVGQALVTFTYLRPAP